MLKSITTSIACHVMSLSLPVFFLLLSLSPLQTQCRPYRSTSSTGGCRARPGASTSSAARSSPSSQTPSPLSACRAWSPPRQSGSRDGRISRSRTYNKRHLAMQTCKAASSLSFDPLILHEKLREMLGSYFMRGFFLTNVNRRDPS